MTSSRSLSLAVVSFIVGCIVKDPEPYPLYPHQKPRPDDQVGVLVGPLAVVDGQNVSGKGQTFALLPGCHSFRLLQTTGEINSGSGSGYITSLPQATLSVLIKAGHYYTFETTLHEVGAPVGSVSMGIADRQRDGAVTPAQGCGG